MPSRISLATLVVMLAASLVLTGCDGWVTQRYQSTPYAGRGIDSDDRTAGYGVEYVRASMMPSKGVETKEMYGPPVPPPPPPAPPLKSAEPLYNRDQEK